MLLLIGSLRFHARAARARRMFGIEEFSGKRNGL
jgi:hypothetical protein